MQSNKCLVCRELSLEASYTFTSAETSAEVYIALLVLRVLISVVKASCHGSGC